jgi:hypothetical protein
MMIDMSESVPRQIVRELAEASAVVRAEEKAAHTNLQCETDQLRTKLHQAVSDLGRSHYEIQAAVSKERDRCQRIVEQFAKSGDYRVMANLIIAAISQGPP